MEWIEVSIETTGDAVEAIAEILNSHGANGVEINDPWDIILKDRETFNWDYVDEAAAKTENYVRIKAYYQDSNDIDSIVGGIKASIENAKCFLDVGDYKIELKKVSESDWENEWKKYYKSFRIANRILIKPTWEEAEPENGDIIVELDPGMAFGTGTHESTRMSIEFLEKYLTPEKTMIDVGCGSGILSIVGAKLGASKVVGIDTDPLAVRITEENIILNNVESIARAKQCTMESLDTQKVDVVVANIVADVIINITDSVKNFLNHEGLYIVSGIIKGRADNVRAKLIGQGFEMIEEKNSGEWVAMIARCLSTS